MIKAITTAILVTIATPAFSDDQPSIDWDALSQIQPGDEDINHCTQDCTPDFDAPYEDDQGFSYDIWHCEVVSKEEYETGNYPGGTICRKTSY